MNLLSLTMIFNPVAATAYTNARFGEGVNANLTSFRCRGTESELLNCDHDMGSCSISNSAGVHCYGDVVAGMSLGYSIHIDHVVTLVADINFERQ